MSLGRPLDRSGFHIALICALPLEADLLQEVFDSFYHGFGKQHGDNNAYTTGTIGQHNVVLAHMPGIGVSNAASVASGLNISFPAIEIALVIGICGGVPRHIPTCKEASETDQQCSRRTPEVKNPEEPSDDVFLGDLVLSTSVLQYDFGHQYPGGFKYQQRPFTTIGQKAVGLESALAQLKTTYHQQNLRDKIAVVLEEVLNNRPDVRYPGAGSDRLFRPSYSHKHRRKDSGWSCQACDSPEDTLCEAAAQTPCEVLGCETSSMVVRRQARHFDSGILGNVKHKPSVHFGSIGSGNAVMKSGQHRDRIAAELDDLVAFEMEGAGVWRHFPACLVVKGVCDYADSHKSKTWQLYAAAVAAAGAKSLLHSWSRADLYPSKVTWTTATTDAAYKTTKNEHWIVPRTVNRLFTGRMFPLTLITTSVDSWLQGLTRKATLSVITGMGGQGKSELCLQIASQMQQSFWAVFWVDLSTTSQTEADYLAISTRLGQSAETVQQAKSTIENCPKTWLLILDNADDVDFDYQEYIPSGQHGYTIMTSRNPECGIYATAKHVDLYGLDDTDAQTLLLKAAKTPASRPGGESEHALKVCKLVGNHPLALIQAGTYISKQRCGFDGYCRIYERNRARLLQFHPTQAKSRYGSVYATFEATVSSSAMSNDGADALQLLHLLAMLGLGPLPMTTFEAAWEGARKTAESEGTTEDLESLTLWHINNLPSIIEHEEPFWDPYRLREAIEKLISMALLSEDEKEDCVILSMHPLVHAWAREHQGHSDRLSSWTTALCTLALSYETDSVGSTYARQVQAHILALFDVPMEDIFNGRPRRQVLQALLCCGTCLKDARADTKVLLFISKLMAFLQLEPHKVHIDYLPVHKLYASSLRLNGRRQESVDVLEQIVDEHRKHPEKCSADSTSVSKFNLAMTYLEVGQTEPATNLLDEVYELDKTRDPAHPRRLATESKLAQAYFDNGNNSKALQLIQQVVQVQDQLESFEAHDLAQSRTLLARVHIRDEQFDKGIELLEHVCKVLYGDLEETHPDSLVTHHILGTAYLDSGQPELAKDVLRNVARIENNIQDIEAQSRLITVDALMRAYLDTGEEDEAASLLADALSSISSDELRRVDSGVLESLRHLANKCSQDSSWHVLDLLVSLTDCTAGSAKEEDGS
ncbi:tetratricopeptide repeat-containing protein 2 [Elsinoe australis]|uniref:Tetratricopeptide repeat-containing protein 2 n=1 Tax=Elsinoe australis TaxID=40998 RepID=A0A4U7B7Y1_9PEZI|nr:tetratricopeptide repeat-containing protein 2 [Elsinoe australis]